MIKNKKVFAFFFLFFLVSFSAQAAKPGILNSPIVADVTTRSFSVIWVVDSNSADPHIFVYQNPSGTPGSPSDITSSLTIDLMPVNTGNISQTSADIQLAAQTRGIQKVRVSGLNLNTTYYYQVYSSNIDGDSALSPSLAGFVHTEFQTNKTKLNGPDTVPFSNEIMVVELFDETGADLNGGIVLFDIADASYPSSAFVGDGIDSPFAMIDLNNIFNNTSHENMDCMGGEYIDLLIIRGSNCPQEQIKYRIVPINNQLSEAKLLNPCYDYDKVPMCVDNNCDGIIDIDDAQNILNLFMVTRGQCSYNDDYDVNGDDIIDIDDAQAALDFFMQSCM